MAMSPKKLSILGVILSFFMLTGCSLFGNEFKISIKEADVNALLQGASLDALPFSVDRVDMQDGTLRIYLSYQKADEPALTGSYDLVLTVDDGDLKAKISNVDMQGLNLDQQILDQIGDLILREFTLPASNLGSRVVYQSVNITNDEIQLTLRISQ